MHAPLWPFAAVAVLVAAAWAPGPCSADAGGPDLGGNLTAAAARQITLPPSLGDLGIRSKNLSATGHEAAQDSALRQSSSASPSSLPTTLAPNSSTPKLNTSAPEVELTASPAANATRLPIGVSASDATSSDDSTSPTSVAATTTTTIPTTDLNLTFVPITPTAASNGSSPNGTVPLSMSSLGKQPFIEPSRSAAVLVGIFVSIAVLGYVGLMAWRRFLEKKYGNREVLVNEDDFDPSDLKHFEL